MSLTTSQFNASRRPRWVLPVIVGTAGIAVLALITILIARPDPVSAPTPPPRGEVTGPDTNALPGKLEWKLIDGVRLPFSKVDGPARVSGPIASGYSHTPQGAVVAAWQISTRLAASADYEQVMAAQVRGTEADRTQVRQEVARVRNLTADQFSQRFTAPAGFQIVHYSDVFVQMYFATQSPTGGYDFTARAVLWDGKDWQYQLVSGLPSLPNSTSIADFTVF